MVIQLGAETAETNTYAEGAEPDLIVISMGMFMEPMLAASRMKNFGKR